MHSNREGGDQGERDKGACQKTARQVAHHPCDVMVLNHRAQARIAGRVEVQDGVRLAVECLEKGTESKRGRKRERDRARAKEARNKTSIQHNTRTIHVM